MFNAIITVFTWLRTANRHENREDVIPAEAGIQQVIELHMHHKSLDSRFRGNDA